MRYTIWIFILTGFLVTITNCKKDQPESPEVSSLYPNNIIDTSAGSGGNVISDGGSEVSARGVCWSTNQNPTINDRKTIDGSGKGIYLSKLTGLIAKTKYYVRAYATNSVGTSYGESYSFMTLQLPTVATSVPSEITYSSAVSGGNITNDGGTSITTRGVCWSKLPNPTISDKRTFDGEGAGIFKSNISGLTENTTYYIRAYAINSAGVCYGSDQTILTLPNLKQISVSNITSTSATFQVNIADIGSEPIASNGFCWSTTKIPIISDNKKELSYTSFNSSLTGLTAFTRYYVRAYVYRGIDTFYSPVVTFSTKSQVTLKDVDGNIYSTVAIDTQVWMAENLKTTRYNNGDPIQKITSDWSNLITTGAYCSFNYDDTYIPVYGSLYNGFVVTDNRNVCPVGWHVPTYSDWDNLIAHLGGIDIAGGKMKDTDFILWNSPNVEANNSSNFCGLPGGRIDANYDFVELGKRGFWWCSTTSNEFLLHYFRVDKDNASVYNWVDFRYSAYSIRCIKD